MRTIRWSNGQWAERMCRRKLAGLSEPKWRFSAPLWALGIPWRLAQAEELPARGRWRRYADGRVDGEGGRPEQAKNPERHIHVDLPLEGSCKRPSGK